jgi:hypothetical protein
MTSKFDAESKTLYLIQGDSGYLYVGGLNKDEAQRVYFGIYDEKRQVIGKELEEDCELNKDFVEFNFTTDYTSKLTVPLNKSEKTYKYAIKVHTLGTTNEDTMNIGGGDIGEEYEVVVYPERLKGY